MKNMKKNALFVSIFAAVILLFSCDLDNSGDPNNPGNQTGLEPDFTSHNTNYSILVRNNTGERLIAFKGELNAICPELVGNIL